MALPPPPPPPPAVAASTTPPPAPAQQAAPPPAPAQQAEAAEPWRPIDTYQEPSVPATISQVPTIDWTSDMKSIAAAQGFADLEFDQFGTFPVVTLTNDLKFTLSSGGDLGSAFICQIHEGKKKYLYNNGLPMSDKQSDAFYSYDQVTTTKGEQVRDRLAAWQQAGYTPAMRTYMDLVCRLDSGKIVILSVPPQSVTRFAAYFAETISRQIPVAQATCRVSVGEKVTNVNVPFHPMKFELIA